MNLLILTFFTLFQVYRGPETKHVVESLECGVEYAMRVCPVRIMRKNPGQGKRNREKRVSDSSSSIGGSRSSSCSQREGDQQQQMEPHLVEEDKECDNVELMGQWSPVLSYVVPPQGSTGENHQSHAAAGDHHHPHHHHHHIHHPHNHHSHNHHSHHSKSGGESHHSHNSTATVISEGKSGELRYDGGF